MGSLLDWGLDEMLKSFTIKQKQASFKASQIASDLETFFSVT